MTSKKIYACYRCIKKDKKELQYIEFWSMNKHIYDEYVEQYRHVLDPDEYMHVVLPISELGEMIATKSQYQLYVETEDTECPIITNALDMEMIDPTGFVLNQVVDFFDGTLVEEMLSNLPVYMYSVLAKTRYLDMIYQGVNVPFATDIPDINITKANYLSRCMYYSNKDLLDLVGCDTLV